MKRSIIRVGLLFICFLFSVLLLFSSCNGEAPSGQDQECSDGNHIAGEWISDLPPSCVTEGSKHQACQVCGVTLDTATIAAKGHSAGEWIVDVEATKTDGGSRHISCTSCQTVLETEAIPPKGSKGLSYTVNEDGVTCMITGLGSCKDTELYIPSVIKGYTVTRIADNSFHQGKNLTAVFIPSSVLSIEGDAFNGCNSLTAVCISDIEAWCRIEFESSQGNPVRYAKNLYLNNELLTDLKIPDTITNIGRFAFYGCESLVSVSIGNHVESIGCDAFAECPNLQYQYYNNAKYLGNEQNPYLVLTIFENNTAKHCEIHPDTKFIHSGAFQSCDSLDTLIMHDKLVAVGENAFGRCHKLESVYITDMAMWCRLKFLTQSANPLYCAQNLYLNSVLVTDAVIPEGVASIGNYAFSGYQKLTSVVIPDSVSIIGAQAFSSCVKLKTVYMGTGVRQIKSSAFFGVGWLSLHITELESWLKIELDGTGAGNPIGTVEKLYLNGQLVENLVIPDGVQAIGDFAFCGFSGIVSVQIPDSVTQIGKNAFSHCAKLASVTLPKHITTIDIWTFYDCSNLLSVVIPQGVTTILGSAFAECDKLTSITLPDSIQSIGDSAFYGCKNLSAVYVSDLSVWLGIAFETEDANPLCNGADLYINDNIVVELVIPDDVAAVLDHAFYHCGSLVSVAVPNHVTAIGSSAFAHCEELAVVELGKGLSHIGAGAFAGCISLPSIVIPDGVTTISNSMFEDCTSLVSVHIPDGVTVIGINAFYLCSKLVNINIPSSVQEIRGQAFRGCTSLASIIIPKSVGFIEYMSFYDCTGLISVYYGGAEGEWDNIKTSEWWWMDEYSHPDLYRAERYFYSETDPNETGNYWHCVDGLPVAW